MPTEPSIQNPGSAGVTQTSAVTGSPAFGQTTVTTAGTQVQLTGSSYPATNGVTIYNAGTSTITVGGSGVNNTITGAGNGDILPSGVARVYAVQNANQLYINSSANGGYVSWSVS